MKIKKKGSRFGTYPSCDHINCAIHFLMEKGYPDEDTRAAISELYYAIFKANGYVYDYVAEELKSIGIDVRG